LDKKTYIFLPELRAPNFASIDPRYSVLDEWDLTTARIEFMSDQSGRKKGRTYPNIVIRLKCERKWKTYLYNMILLLFALTGLSLTAFFLSFDDLGDRLGLLITLLLTIVAFSIVIQDKLPTVTYLTFMDRYILASYVFIIVIVIESIAMTKLESDEERQAKWDHFLFYFFLGLWGIIFFGAFSVYAYILKQREEKKLHYNSDEVDKIVGTQEPTLKFDYKMLSRTGDKKRILSFEAIIPNEDQE